MIRYLKYWSATCLIGQELLALGERIGTVSTGLSEDSISKCLKKTTYCPSDQMQDEENCVICLVRLEKVQRDLHFLCITDCTESPGFGNNCIFYYFCLFSNGYPGPYDLSHDLS